MAEAAYLGTKPARIDIRPLTPQLIRDRKVVLAVVQPLTPKVTLLP